MTNAPIYRFEVLGSTMHRAAELAAQGCPTGSVVVADEQTAGHGRYGRAWHSEKHTGLYMSQVLRLKICTDSLPLVTLALGLATAEAISKTAAIGCDLRWPNDVLINDRKCAGILAQLEPVGLITGIGINVNQVSFPADLQTIATSLRIATGKEHSREALLDALIESVGTFLHTLMSEGKEPILRAFSAASSYVHGRRVAVEQAGATLTGTTEGLDPQGFLILRETTGKRTLILAGGVRSCS